LKQKRIRKQASVQTYIDRELYADLVRICALDDISLKQLIQDLIQDYTAHDKFLTRQWKMTDTEYKECLEAYERYLNLRDKVSKRSEKK